MLLLTLMWEMRLYDKLRQSSLTLDYKVHGGKLCRSFVAPKDYFEQPDEDEQRYELRNPYEFIAKRLYGRDGVPLIYAEHSRDKSWYDLSRIGLTDW